MPKVMEVNEDLDVCDADSSQPSFQSLVVVEFSSRSNHETIQWMLDKITLSCGLRTSSILDENHKVKKVHISASTDKLLEVAEKMELKKMCKDKERGMLEFTKTGLKKGIFDFDGNLDTFLTTAEKQRIIRHELELLRTPSEMGERVPGTKLHLLPGEAVFPRCQHDGIITDFYALHSKHENNHLHEIWTKAIFSRQPLEKVRDYFGETVAFYFAFLGFYTYFLVPPAVLGILSYLFAFLVDEGVAIALFCIFNLVWTTVFLESWKRRTAELAYKWGTIRMDKFEEPRAAFYGLSNVIDPVTNRLQPQYPSRRRLLKFYLVSVPVMGVALSIAFLAMLSYFWLDELVVGYVKENTDLPTIVTALFMLMPTIIYAVFIIGVYAVYRPLAVFLNNWENHRLQSAYDNHLVVKLMVFNFANYFMSLFYVAFYLQDIVLLRQHLATLLITMQLVQQFQESILPYFVYKVQKVQIVRKFYLGNGCKNDEIDKATLIYAERDAVKQPYASTMEDYLEMCLQFGYVFFFSAVFPTAAFWALLNNLIEMRTDAFKLCRTVKRPFAQPAANIGVWEVAFEVMSVVAVISNCTLLALSPSVKDYWSIYGTMKVALFFFAVEHAVLFIKVTLAHLIPDAPEWVETKLAAAEYQTKFRSRLQSDNDDHMKIE